MKDNEMLFEIIYNYVLWFVGVVSVLYRCNFSVIQVKASKFTKKEHIKRTESQEEIQTA